MHQESSLAPALELIGYGVSFGRRVVLSSVDLVLPAMGIDVLMGPVKTGKSTLMRSLAGLNQGNALYRYWGEARMYGRALDDAWRPTLVQQHAAILNASVRDALIYYVRQHAEKSSTSWRETAQATLATYGLERVVPSLDAHMLTLPVEWQRAITILSHALVKPPLLLVDEPAYGLDEAAASRLIEWLTYLGKTVRMVVVLHHQGQARRLAQRVTLLGGGRVLCSDENPRFFTHPGNAWAEQFIRTGSLSIASPDAQVEELADDVPPPPPLPAQALEALASFARSQPPEPPPPVTRAPTPAPTSPAPSPESAPVASPPASPAPAPLAPVRAPTVLPPLSRNGVEDASMVGRAIFSNYRGPQGFHWIVPGRLAGCAEPGITSSVDYDLDLLKNMGIKYLVTLTEKDLDQDALARHGLLNIHLPIFDREAPSFNQAYMLVRRMQVLLDKGHALAVHCKAGIGRTGTILATWLIREGGISAESAIQRLRAINPAYVQTEMQEQFLRAFEEDMLRRMQ